jgi:hypothetical protein
MSVKRNEVHDDPIKNSRHEPHGFFFPVKDKVCTNLTTSTKPTIVGIDIQNRDYISLTWSDGRSSRFHHMQLRSFCLCPQCQHETGQRLVNSADIQAEPNIEEIYRKSFCV